VVRFLVSTVLELCGFAAWVAAAFLLWGVVGGLLAAVPVFLLYGWRLS